MRLLAVFILLAFGVAFCYAENGIHGATCAGIVATKRRPYIISIRRFGAVGDGKTLNTKAFQAAVSAIRQANQKRTGGVLLYVPTGTWLTGSFNLTSHMTLYLAKNAVLKASQDTNAWPVIDPLPSYGRGRERPGGRYISFIHGDGLQDVSITGENGTIDGQGEVWWNMWRDGSLKYTRGNLVEIMNSKDVIISNVVLLNSPFWNIHPVYCSNVVIRRVTILAPAGSPNTDGIDPDSSSNVCIEDCYVSNGDDVVAIKSGWDEYGIAYGRPSSNIIVRRVTGTTQGFSGIAIGSETSGGIRDILIEHVNIHNSGTGIRLKTNAGRGGTIENITISDIYMENVRTAIRFSGDTGDHPDTGYNPAALPVVRSIAVKNVVGKNVQNVGSMEGLKASPFRDICLTNITLQVMTRDATWKCWDVEGSAVGVTPPPCAELTRGMSPFCSSSYLRNH
uniref:TSA: Wollemia nobilis Ref_Wollemi_Transcript_12193_2100 transcribed RNA sequence n=1 Tax=Wollemia nobilis TaxID=56998 RepID=A0A0C9S615_9CONI